MLEDGGKLSVRHVKRIRNGMSLPAGVQQVVSVERESADQNDRYNGQKQAR
jgi:hypothetical protein